MSSTQSGQMVGKKHPLLEAVYGSLSGMAFGLLSPLASQPFDTIKTKMQAETRYAKASPFLVGRELMQVEGARGFYRGMVPILLSTGAQKSALFAGYAGAKRACDQSQIGWLTAPIPYMNGMNSSVIVGSMAASTARTIVETPFELAKVRRQVHQKRSCWLDVHMGRRSAMTRTLHEEDMSKGDAATPCHLIYVFWQTGGSFRSTTGIFSLQQVLLFDVFLIAAECL